MLVSAPGPPYKEGAVLPGQQHLLGLGPVHVWEEPRVFIIKMHLLVEGLGDDHQVDFLHAGAVGEQLKMVLVPLFVQQDDLWLE